MIIASLFALISASTPDSYVVVVGNNQSPVLGRPQLAYADDDAVRAVEVFEALLGNPTVELFTELDADTQRLFPQFVERATTPRRAAVVEAFSRLANWAKERRAAGKRTRGYFVFAGHGDIAGGEGFIELQDGRLTAGDFEALLTSAGTDELHVVLDSCNSWFVLSPRKPGGHRFPTPAEATRSLTERMPNVGVILSTSAEAEVYEWSELQSGIFSYALRSGLMGAADANGDGDIAYDELAAFIDTATHNIKNPNLRPRIFARAPGGGVRGAFASLAEARGVELVVKSDEAMQLRVRDGSGMRWFDAHLAPGSAKLHLPRRLADEGGLVERNGDRGWSAWTLPVGQAEVQLEKLTAATNSAASRGATEALQTLFSTPYGLQSVIAWNEAEVRGAETAALGISQATVDRMGFLLGLAEKRDRGYRITRSVLFGTFGLGGGISFFAMQSSLPESSPGRALGYGMSAGIGVGFLTAGLIGLFIPTEWERQAQSFSSLVKDGRPNEAMFKLDQFLDQRMSYYKTTIVLTRILSAVIFAGGASLVGIGFAANFGPENEQLRRILPAVGSLYAAMGAGLFVSTFFLRMPEQDLYDALREERRVSDQPVSLNFSITPLPSGAGATLSGRF